VSSNEPNDLASLVEALSSAEASVAEFFGSLTPAEASLRVDDAWTPLEHLAHLSIAVSAVARGFGVARWLLRLRFGRGGMSRSYSALRADYLMRLKQGGGARGRFVPQHEDLDESGSASRQAELLARWHRVNQRLILALQRWSEKDLDRIRLPHPLLGNITAREMLFFTVYHDQHHIASAKSRLPRFSTTSSARPDLTREPDATWVDTVIAHVRTARRLILTPGDAGAQPTTKIGGAPWWPRGVQRPQCDRGHQLSFYMQLRLSDVPGWEDDDDLLSFHYCDACMYDGNPAIGWYQEGTEGIAELAHAEASAVRILPTSGHSSDGKGIVTQSAITAYVVAFDDIDEIPGPNDLPETIDLPDDFFGGTDLDPIRPGGFAFVGRCKIGGWPAWDQDVVWPTCEHHGRMSFVAQIDAEVAADAYWGGGGHAFLFACPRSCANRRGEAVIQTT
jgi:hypothetical protein